MRRLAGWSCFALLAGAIWVLGCQSTNACKQGTLLVTVTFEGPAVTADELEVDVAIGPGLPKRTSLPHAVAMAEGSIEIAFPGGYPAGRQVNVVLRALKAGEVVGIGHGSVGLPDGCGTLSINVGRADGGTDASGGAGTGAAGTGGGAGTGAAGTSGGAGTSAAGTGGGGRGGAGGGAGTGAAGTGAAGTSAAGTGGGGRGGAGGGAGTGMVVIPTAGLVAYYELNGNGVDASGHAYNGMVFGGMATTDRFGRAGGALSFTGLMGDSVIAAPEPPFDLPTFTITAFVRIAPSTNQRVIFSKAPVGGFGNFTLQVNADNAPGALAGRMSWTHDTAMGNFSAGASLAALPLGTYVHVAVTLDASALRFYVDGAPAMAHLNPPPPALNDAPFRIARGAFNGFVGAIDSVRVYNRVLSAAEIAAISQDR